MIVVNVGDFCCVVFEVGKVLDMFYDYKLEDEVELVCIKNVGGKVIMDG